MVDVGSLQAAYNDAVARGNKKLAEQLLALWRDALVDRTPKRSLSTGRDPSEAGTSPLITDGQKAA
jgi:hypothetical protein